MAPVQAIFLPVSDDFLDAAFDARDKLRAKGIRAEVDTRSERLGYKIRDAELHKVPYMLVVGKREVETNTFSLRTWAEGDRGSIAYDDLEAEILQRIANRVFDVKLEKIEWDAGDDDDLKMNDY